MYRCIFHFCVSPSCLAVGGGQIEFKSTLKELDRQLSLCLPSNQRADISFKSSATPVRTIFELPVPVESAGAHVNYR